MRLAYSFARLLASASEALDRRRHNRHWTDGHRCDDELVTRYCCRRDHFRCLFRRQGFAAVRHSKPRNRYCGIGYLRAHSGIALDVRPFITRRNCHLRVLRGTWGLRREPDPAETREFGRHLALGIHSLCRCRRPFTCKFPPFVTIFAGALCGGILAVFQDPSRVLEFASAPDLPTPLALLKGIWSALATGYVSKSGDPSLDLLLTRGGMSSMMVTVWLIISALSFGAVIEHAGLLNRLVDPLIDRIKSVGGLVVSVVAACVGANVLTSDQYIAIALPGRLFRPVFAKWNLAPVVLSRTLGDLATVTSPLIPWNSCGAYMAATLGVPTISYLAFCFFNIANPIFAVLFAALGLRVLTISKSVDESANQGTAGTKTSKAHDAQPSPH